MGLLDAYQDSTDTALRVMAARPLEAETPKPKHSAWSTIPRAVIAATAEVAGTIADVAGAYGQVSAAMGQNANPLLPDSAEDRKQRLDAYDKLKSDGIDWRAGEPAYGFARDLRPDPLTAGAAENIVFGLTKGLTKAIGAGVALGPMVGAGAFGASEGMTTADDLAEQGVDVTTRTKVGAVSAGINAVGMALPVAGKTLAQTAALVAAGGPGSFVAQQAASRAILENADYHQQAQQFDPLDPTGLALATLLPAGFAAWAKGGQIKAALSGRRTTQTEADAAMVQNLTAARDAHETSDPAALAELLPQEKKAMPAELPPMEASVAETPSVAAADPLIGSILGRIETLKTEQPDMPVALREDGTPARLAEEIDAIRRQAREGTDTEFGLDDAPLLKVAAECFLSIGAAA